MPHNSFSLFSLVSNNLIKLWKKTFKLFTNCHVSWDTLSVRMKMGATRIRFLVFYSLEVYITSNSLISQDSEHSFTVKDKQGLPELTLMKKTQCVPE